jgi:hypothetical protein
MRRFVETTHDQQDPPKMPRRGREPWHVKAEDWQEKASQFAHSNLLFSAFD